MPPPPGTGTDGLESVLYTNEASPDRVPPGAEPTFEVLTVPLTMYGSVAGDAAKTEASTPKFLARMSLGVWATQSGRLKVVLIGQQRNEERRETPCMSQ